MGWILFIILRRYTSWRSNIFWKSKVMYTISTLLFIFRWEISSLHWISSLFQREEGYIFLRPMFIPKTIKQAARDLRRNQTPAEELFWNYCRRTRWEMKVYRQKPILVMREDNGFERFIIADFYFPQWKLIVELDGWVHSNKDVYELDWEKELLLQNIGYTILRFTNEKVLWDMQTVITQIEASLSSGKREN